jgi:mannosyltransferase
LTSKSTDHFRSCLLGFPAEYLDICALTILSLSLNLMHLAARSVDLDESASVAFARLSLPSLASLLSGGNPNMGFYYVLLSVWIRIFGESEAAIRFPSALCGALSVAAIYLLGSRLFGRMVGFVAGLLLALDSFVVEHAHSARGYTMLILLITMSSYFLVVELEQPSKLNRIAYVLTSTLAVYTHYFAAYVLLVHAGAVLALKRRAALNREWLEMAVAVLLLCTPEAIFAYRKGSGGIAWIKRPSLRNIGSVLVDLAGGSRIILAGLLIGGCCATAISVRATRYWPIGFVAAWLVMPILLSFAASFAIPMFIPYYLIICVPALILFGLAGLPKIKYPLLGWLLIAPFIWLSATQLRVFYARTAHENWRDATRYVLADMGAGDAIVFYPPYAHNPFDYYRRQSELAGPAKLPENEPGNARRIWLVTRESDLADGSPELQKFQSSLSERYQLIDRRSFRNIEVKLYAGKSDGP